MSEFPDNAAKEEQAEYGMDEDTSPSITSYFSSSPTLACFGNSAKEVYSVW